MCHRGPSAFKVRFGRLDSETHGWDTIDDAANRGAVGFTVGGDAEESAEGRHVD